MPIWKQSADPDIVDGWSTRTRMRAIDIRIENEAGELVCIARLTVAVVPRRVVATKPA